MGMGDLEARVVDALKVNVDQANEDLLNQVISAAGAAVTDGSDVTMGQQADNIDKQVADLLGKIKDDLNSPDNSAYVNDLKTLNDYLNQIGAGFQVSCQNGDWIITNNDGTSTNFGDQSHFGDLITAVEDRVTNNVTDPMRNDTMSESAKETYYNSIGDIYWDGKPAELNGTAGVALLEFAKNAIQNVNTNLSGMGAQPDKSRKVVERFIGSINS